MKKLALVLLALILGFASVAPLTQTSAAGTNLIANPSVENSNTAATLPLSWNQGKWGTNTTSFSYKTTEGNTGTKSLYINTTSYTSGDAKWYFSDVAVKANQKYTYGEFYKSSVATEVDIQYTDTTGKLSYVWLGTAAASSAYKAFNASFTTPANVKSLTIFHVINKVGWLQTDDFSLTEDGGTTTPPVPTAPTVSVTAPTAGTTLSNTAALSATAGDAVSVAGVQFKVDNVNVGTEDTTAPYSVNWDSKTVANGTHTLSAVARNSSNLTTTSSPVSINVQNTVVPSAPTVSVTAPVSGSTVSGTQTVSANASSTGGVKNVQFKLDGNNLGSADTTAPYNVSWDTKTVTNESHTLTAVATNNSNVAATAANVTVTVNNPVIPPPTTPNNLIPNPSLETANGTAPASWLASNWGTNTASFTYLNTGHTGSRSVKTEITSYTNGAANWYYADIPATAGKTYKYENWYQSNVDTEVDAQVTMNDGSVQYFWLGVVPASTTWAKYSATFTVPSGAKSLAIYQLLAKKGFVSSDDYSLTEYTPLQFNRAVVTLTFDDGWRSIYTNGLPLLKKYGFVSTQYLNSEPIIDGYSDYMTYQHVKDFYGQGHELAWHTQTHANLTTLNVTAINRELTIPNTFLQNLGLTASTFKNFATPYGAYNTTVINEIKKSYRTHRGVEEGFNSKDSLNLYNIKVKNILNTTTTADVKSWVDQAIRDKTWLVILYHEVGTSVEDPTYAVTATNLDQQLSYIMQTGVTVKTVNQALDELVPQL